MSTNATVYFAHSVIYELTVPVDALRQELAKVNLEPGDLEGVCCGGDDNGEHVGSLLKDYLLGQIESGAAKQANDRGDLEINNMEYSKEED